ncbi:hypothetical protein PIB30_045993 [Stylosanthes scabra]|uniref:H15 domain-containing protein n=1 Tax=Stylosanthes scabra TaxID=79078 RepID=A0ABU6UI72_9FABA|nr:hypothetical protein [Stylosanthes scabra]
MVIEEVDKSQLLPPYPEMIMKAIEEMGESNGASKSAISNYIESTYGELPPGHTPLLSHHLNKMKESGEVVFLKNNYMKPDPNAPPKRGRGRPPKPKAPLPPGTVLSPPRPRGRPPKDPNAPPSAKVPSGRPRGRPKKVPRTTDEAIPYGSSTGRLRGRPPKMKPHMAEVSVE